MQTKYGIGSKVLKINSNNDKVLGEIDFPKNYHDNSSSVVYFKSKELRDEELNERVLQKIRENAAKLHW